MIRKIIVPAWAVLLLIVFCYSFKTKHDLTIRLQYYYQPPLSNQRQIKTGIKWVISYLGATLPEGSIDSSIQWLDNQEFLIDLKPLGFSAKAEKVWCKMLKKMKKSEAYKKHNALDLGRFVMLTINHSPSYYAITGMPKKYRQFKEKHVFKSQPLIALENGESGITEGNRVIFDAQYITELTDIAFIALEGEGGVKEGTFEATEFEVYEIMPNGQPRFGVYSKKGKLKEGVDPKLGKAGKPVKCMWCHESKILPSFKANPDKPHLEIFNQTIDSKMILLDSFRNELESEFDFSKIKEHNWAELLYITFMEPTAVRLAKEWKIPIEKVKYIISGLPTHINHEFPDMGILYNRKDIDPLAPFETIEVPSSARETNPR